jgi:hypothetical protein
MPEQTSKTLPRAMRSRFQSQPTAACNFSRTNPFSNPPIGELLLLLFFSKCNGDVAQDRHPPNAMRNRLGNPSQCRFVNAWRLRKPVDFIAATTLVAFFRQQLPSTETSPTPAAKNLGEAACEYKRLFRKAEANIFFVGLETTTYGL